jgi:hypothetical protein
MIKLLEENIKQLEDKFVVSDDSQKEATKVAEQMYAIRLLCLFLLSILSLTCSPSARGKDKKDAKKPKSERRRDSVIGKDASTNPNIDAGMIDRMVIEHELAKLIIVFFFFYPCNCDLLYLTS